MRIIRLIGSIALWIGVVAGIVAGATWIATQTDRIQPLVVISGSMEPGIGTGDLLIGRATPTADVQVGDVLSLPSTRSQKYVTHRVIEVVADGDRWHIRMQGDANGDPDLETYVVGDTVWTPWIRVPQGGKVVSKIMEPAVAAPVLLSLIALLGVSLLDEPPRTVRRVIARATGRDRRSEQLDRIDDELAAVGVDVAHLREMDDLDLQLYALGIDITAPDETFCADSVLETGTQAAQNGGTLGTQAVSVVSVPESGTEDTETGRGARRTREPALTG